MVRGINAAGFVPTASVDPLNAAAILNLLLDLRDEFGLTHRYAMALHTDEPHPHVHVLVKAVSEWLGQLKLQ